MAFELKRDRTISKTMEAVQNFLLEKMEEGKANSLIIGRNELFEQTRDFPSGRIENKGTLTVQFENNYLELDFKIVGREAHEELHLRILKAVEELKPKYYRVKEIRLHNAYLCSRTNYSKEELKAGQLYIKLEKPAQQCQGEFKMPEPYTLGKSEWLIEPLLEGMVVEGGKE